MMKKILPLLLLLSLAMTQVSTAKNTVILLHGLARTPKAMAKMQAALETAGYHVVNNGYPSREYSIEELSADLRAEFKDIIEESEKVCFVTHSLGGIILRYMHKEEAIPKLKRVVMLAPPNKGSEIPDKLKHLKIYQWINGPAGGQLGTDEQSIPNELGSLTFECGVIAGNLSINGINSMMIKGRDDGKVSVENTKIEGMKDFKVIPVSHPYIMKNKTVIKETIHFLKQGTFIKETPQ